MEKKLEFTLQLTQSQIDVLLETLSEEECFQRDLADKHLNEITTFGEFLSSNGEDPMDNSVYSYHFSLAKDYDKNASILGTIFDEIHDAVSNCTIVYFSGDDVMKNV